MKKLLQLALFLPLASALRESQDLSAAERCDFPQDPSMLGVKRDFGVKGDGGGAGDFLWQQVSCQSA